MFFFFFPPDVETSAICPPPAIAVYCPASHKIRAPVLNVEPNYWAISVRFGPKIEHVEKIAKKNNNNNNNNDIVFVLGPRDPGPGRDRVDRRRYLQRMRHHEVRNKMRK